MTPTGGGGYSKMRVPLVLSMLLVLFTPQLSVSADVDNRRAIDALKALRSAVEVDITLREYTTRLADAKIVVDRYLERKGGAPAPRAAVSSALSYYLAARQAWEVLLRLNDRIPLTYFDAIADRKLPEPCQPLRSLAETIRGRFDWVTADSRQNVLVERHGNIVGVLWGCASGAIAEADTLIRP